MRLRISLPCVSGVSRLAVLPLQPHVVVSVGVCAREFKCQRGCRSVGSPRSWRYGWVLGLELRSFGRAVRAPSFTFLRLVFERSLYFPEIMSKDSLGANGE